MSNEIQCRSCVNKLVFDEITIEHDDTDNCGSDDPYGVPNGSNDVFLLEHEYFLLENELKRY